MKILFPPHAHIRIASSKLNEYENSKNWIAQRKFNGTNVLVYISRDKKVSILTRHGTAPKLFSLTKSHVEQILSLNLEKDKDYWLNGELLDHKTKDKDYKGKIVFFDVLHAGRYLIQNPSQIERLELLKNICNYPSSLEKNGIALQISDNIWMAESWSNDFLLHYKEFLHKDEIEGLILRKSNSFIDNFGQKSYDVSWIIKCRKPHNGGNYNF
jgi:hypothetical protein